MGGAQSTQRRGSYFETKRQSFIKSELKKLRTEFMSGNLSNEKKAGWHRILSGKPANPLEQDFFERVTVIDPFNEHPNFPRISTSSNTRKKLNASLRKYTEQYERTQTQTQSISKLRSKTQKSSSSETVRPRLGTGNVELLPRNPRTGKFEK